MRWTHYSYCENKNVRYWEAEPHQNFTQAREYLTPTIPPHRRKVIHQNIWRPEKNQFQFFARFVATLTLNREYLWNARYRQDKISSIGKRSCKLRSCTLFDELWSTNREKWDRSFNPSTFSDSHMIISRVINGDSAIPLENYRMTKACYCIRYGSSPNNLSANGEIWTRISVHATGRPSGCSLPRILVLFKKCVSYAFRTM